MLADEKQYKNEIWTRVHRVTIDAPEQVEVHKIRVDIKQTLTDLLDNEQFDDEGPDPVFDANAFKEPPVGAKREDYELDNATLLSYGRMVMKVQDNALKQAAILKNDEEVEYDDVK